MANFQGLTIGSIVTFLMRDTRERYVGTVYEFRPPSRISLVGIKNATVWKMGERCALNSESIYYFSLREIMELQVIEGANRANTNQDGQNNNRDEGSSSKSIESKLESLCLDPPSE